MSEKNVGKVNWSFWVIGSIALIWNVLGVVNFFAQMNPEVLAAYRETERALVEGRSVWATAGFALAVFGGAFGCILLMFKKSVAYYLFIASLLGVFVTMIHTFGVGIEFGVGEIIGIVLLPIAVAVFLIWYSNLAESKGWVS